MPLIGACCELSRCEPVEARVRSVGVVVDPPVFDDPAGLAEVREHVLVEALVAQAASLTPYLRHSSPADRSAACSFSTFDDLLFGKSALRMSVSLENGLYQRRGGTIFRRPSVRVNGRSKRDIRTHLIHRPARGHHSAARWSSSFLPIAFDAVRLFMPLRLPGPARNSVPSTPINQPHNLSYPLYLIPTPFNSSLLFRAPASSISSTYITAAGNPSPGRRLGSQHIPCE